MRDHIIAHRRSALLADMGIGKTRAVLAAIRDLFLTGELAKPVLILGPLNVARWVWTGENEEAGLGLKINVIAGGRTAEHAAIAKSRADIYTINYDNLPWLVSLYGERWPFGMVVCDESTRLKGYRKRRGTLRSEALASRAWDEKDTPARFSKCRWVNLTGTPAPNGYLDLWGQTYFLDKGQRLGGTYTAFRDRWFRVEDPYSRHKNFVPHDWAPAEIKRRINDICKSYEAKDWFDIRDPIVIDRWVKLPPEVMKTYRQFERALRIRLSETKTVTATTAAALSMKCLQVASGAVYVDHTAETHVVHDEKIAELESIIEESGGNPLIVVYHFRSDLARLREAFPGIVTLDAKGKVLKAWNEGKVPLLALHAASAGHGISLQYGGNRIAFFSQWWDYEQYRQVIERIGPARQAQAGFTRPVYIYHILARGTVDELVMARRGTKQSIHQLLMGGLKG